MLRMWRSWRIHTPRFPNGKSNGDERDAPEAPVMDLFPGTVEITKHECGAT